MEAWIVEALDKDRNTIWRQVFSRQVQAERCYYEAKGQGLDVHWWSM